MIYTQRQYFFFFLRSKAALESLIVSTQLRGKYLNQKVYVSWYNAIYNCYSTKTA